MPKPSQTWGGVSQETRCTGPLFSIHPLSFFHPIFLFSCFYSPPSIQFLPDMRDYHKKQKHFFQKFVRPSLKSNLWTPKQQHSRHRWFAMEDSSLVSVSYLTFVEISWERNETKQHRDMWYRKRNMRCIVSGGLCRYRRPSLTESNTNTSCLPRTWFVPAPSFWTG